MRERIVPVGIPSVHGGEEVKLLPASLSARTIPNELSPAEGGC